MHSVRDINHARLNAIMPSLQQMEDDPAYLERQRDRFDADDPPPPYSSRSSTELPTPDLFPPVADGSVDIDEIRRKPLSDREICKFGRTVGYYRPYHRYHDEVRQEKARIMKEWRKRDENYIPLYRGPDLIGRPGQQRLNVMARHSIKKRWERLGVWDPEWGIPNRVRSGPRDDASHERWMWDQPRSGCPQFNSLSYEAQRTSWPSRDEESPDERAVRLHLERQGGWNEGIVLQPPDTDHPTNVLVDDREFLITSRPWYVWKLEVAEEGVRLSRNPRDPEVYSRSRENVTARWKENGDWKKEWGDLPGWKWRHESPSPEPADPNDMEFTPSEVDALEAIPPPTPPPPPVADLSSHGPPIRTGLFGFLPANDPDAPPRKLIPSQPTFIDYTTSGFNAATESVDNVQQKHYDEETPAPPCTLHEELPSSVEAENLVTARQMTRPPRHSIRSAPRRASSGKDVSRALTRPSKISQPTSPPRRSARIAAAKHSAPASTSRRQGDSRENPLPAPSRGRRRGENAPPVQDTQFPKIQRATRPIEPSMISKPRRGSGSGRRGRPKTSGVLPDARQASSGLEDPTASAPSRRSKRLEEAARKRGADTAGLVAADPRRTSRQSKRRRINAGPKPSTSAKPQGVTKSRPRKNRRRAR